jgi:hypothetical protein
MSNDHPTRDSMSLEEATISNMWEIAAMVEVLERKGLRTKHDLYDIITEFRRKNPRASIPETAFPEPYVMTETGNTIIDDIFSTSLTRTACWAAPFRQARPLSSEKGSH